MLGDSQASLTTNVGATNVATAVVQGPSQAPAIANVVPTNTTIVTAGATPSQVPVTVNVGATNVITANVCPQPSQAPGTVNVGTTTGATTRKGTGPSQAPVTVNVSATRATTRPGQKTITIVKEPRVSTLPAAKSETKQPVIPPELRECLSMMLIY